MVTNSLSYVDMIILVLFNIINHKWLQPHLILQEIKYLFSNGLVKKKITPAFQNRP